MKKFEVKFQTNQSNGIVTMYVKCDNIVEAFIKVDEMFDVKAIKGVKEVPNDTLL